MMGKRFRRRQARTEGDMAQATAAGQQDLTPESVISQVRTVIFDQLAWQDKLAEKAGVKLGPISHGEKR